MPPVGLDVFTALALGLIAGLTEFLPVSTAAHLLFAQRFGALGAQGLGAAFVPLVELAALAALLTVYGPRLWRTLAGAVANSFE